MLGKAAADLEWAAIVRAVRSRCAGPTAGEDSLPVAETFAAMEASLGETAEVVHLVEMGEHLPVDGVRDIARSIMRVEKEGTLNGPELRDVSVTLGAARALRKFLGRHRENAPRLFAVCAIDPRLDDLQDEIARAIETDGTIADHASPELKRLRAEVATLRARIVSRMEELVRQHGNVLSDAYYTLREDRYVLPMRADAHDRIQGIVHGTSASGATVFVEPRAIISQGNRLKIAQGEMRREEDRVLAALTEEVRDHVHSLFAAYDALNHADLRSASAKFGRDLRGRMVPVVDAPTMTLERARHPVLALEGTTVVPNDISIRSGHGLVVSGPNAGGKTVALKTVGLAALMVRAGLPLLVGDGSECGFFDSVMTDVGDSQSITKNLSTFSAHMTNVAAMLNATTSRSLVLLDELAGGTDPNEGAALACALVDAFTAKGAAVVVTTHYEAMKARALSSSNLRNASVGFDVKELRPTFALVPDVPGISSALIVAARFGIPQGVVESAKGLVSAEARSFEGLVSDLAARAEEMRAATVALVTERETMAKQRETVERELAQTRARDKKALSEEATRAKDELARARVELSEVRRVLREGKATDAELKELGSALNRVAETVAASKPEETAPAAKSAVVTAALEGAVREGQRVWVPRLSAEGEVVQGPDRGRVQVAVGAMKLWVDLTELRGVVATPAKGGGEKGKAFANAGPRAKPVIMPTRDNTLDVRGLRAEEAVSLVDSFLDRMFSAEESAAYVLHGVGTGALRDAVRDHLRRGMAYGATWRPAAQDEGGDKLTVVLFS